MRTLIVRLTVGVRLFFADGVAMICGAAIGAIFGSLSSDDPNLPVAVGAAVVVIGIVALGMLSRLQWGVADDELGYALKAAALKKHLKKDNRISGDAELRELRKALMRCRVTEDEKYIEDKYRFSLARRTMKARGAHVEVLRRESYLVTKELKRRGVA